MNPFEQVVKDLGARLNIALNVDANQACRIDFGEGVQVQIDLVGYGDQLLVGCELGILTAGTYRERLFRQALIINGSHSEAAGILAFSEKKSALMLFQFLSLNEINEERFAHFLTLFVNHAKLWRKAIASEEIPQIADMARIT